MHEAAGSYHKHIYEKTGQDGTRQDSRKRIKLFKGMPCNVIKMDCQQTPPQHRIFRREQKIEVNSPQLVPEMLSVLLKERPQRLQRSSPQPCDPRVPLSIHPACTRVTATAAANNASRGAANGGRQLEGAIYC